MKNWMFGLAVFLLAAPVLATGSDQLIYARITTVSGDTLEGPVRWTSNEVSWFDILDASKRIPEQNYEVARREGLLSDRRNREVRLLGFKLFSIDDNTPETASAGIRFGQIRRLKPVGRNGVLTLKSGLEVRLEDSSDLGSDVELTVEDQKMGVVNLKWRDLAMVDFIQPEPEPTSRFGKRIYGTLITRSGAGFTGFICWDVDEVLTSDILDGSHQGSKKKVAFGDIQTIERIDSRSARVGLTSGEQLELSGTNDVNSDNRGIIVVDPSFGQVRIDWGQFDKLILEEPSQVAMATYDGGIPLQGTVVAVDGTEYTGRIRWDNDEEYSWEFLDGRYKEIDFDIEMGAIRSIERNSMRSAVVTLLDGRTFELSGSNDVNEDNKGIFVTGDDGRLAVLRWADFRRVDFSR